MTLNVKCFVCKRNFVIEVPKEGYVEWCNGTLIQDAMPTISPAERELLISGTCGKCFDEMFKEEEEDETTTEDTTRSERESREHADDVKYHRHIEDEL